jgi:hypothetical protein
MSKHLDSTCETISTAILGEICGGAGPMVPGNFWAAMEASVAAAAGLRPGSPAWIKKSNAAFKRVIEGTRGAQSQYP